MMIRDLQTGVLMQIPSTEAGRYTLDRTRKYRVWFDWDAILPSVEVASISKTETQYLDDRIDNRVDVRFEITSEVGDVFIPFSGFDYEFYPLYGEDSNRPAVIQSASSGATLSYFKGECGVWVTEGESVEIRVQTLFSSTDVPNYNQYQFNLDEVEAWFSDDSEVTIEISGAEAKLIFYGGKG